MKTLFTTLLCFIYVQWAFSQESEKKISSKIREATVFLSGAQVTRTATVEIPPGARTFVLDGISPRINEQSIQVEAPGPVKILSVSFRVNHLNEFKKSDQIAALEKERARLNSLIKEEKNMEDVYREEEAMLKSNKTIGGQQAGVNIGDLKLAVEYFRQRLIDIKSKQHQLQKNIVSYSEEVSRIESQLSELKNRKLLPSGEIVLKLSAKSEIKTNLKVSYLVQEARWLPSYDIRAKDIKSPISITYKATVSQQSGEDWENVGLTISSANPSATGAKPIMQPWYLGFNNELAARSTTLGQTLVVNQSEIRGRVVSLEDGLPLPGVNVIIKGTTVGTVTDINGEYSIPLTGDAKTLIFSFIGMQSQEMDITGNGRVDIQLQPDVKQLSEVVVRGFGADGSSYGVQREYYHEPRIKRTIVATPVVRQINVEYKIDEPYTIRSDGENRAVEMIEYEVDALYQYYCAPKLDADVFLTARLIDWDEYNFLEGEASLFFEGKYVGKSILDTRNTDDTLAISLGRDKNVLVTREKVRNFSSSQLLGGNRKALYGYEIKVRNKKQQELEIRIEDQIPVPNTKEIVVDKLEDSDAEYDEETGILVWNRKIKPGQTEKIDLRYSVRYPKYSRIILE